MTYETYYYIFLGGAILASIMLLVSILVFFLLKIPTVIGDLSGSTARKAIDRIRNQNESTGTKTHRPSPVNRERGKITDKITPSGQVIKDPTASPYGAMSTAKLNAQQIMTPMAPAAEATTVLAESNETTVLSGNETTVLSPASAGNETTVLTPAPAQTAFVVEYEITYIHTDERIA